MDSILKLIGIIAVIFLALRGKSYFDKRGRSGQDIHDAADPPQAPQEVDVDNTPLSDILDDIANGGNRSIDSD